MYSIPLIVVFVLSGIAMLYFGGDALVRGSVSLALRKGISRMTVGLTVVALGTSAPEFFVSLIAVLRGETDISIGNILGSNTANIALVLGLSAAIRPVVVEARTLRVEMPFVIASSVLLYVLAINGVLGRLDGLILFGAFGFFLYYCFRNRKEMNDFDTVDESESAPVSSSVMDWVRIIGGLAALAVGSELFVRGASDLARLIGVSDLVIGLTIVALGTSLPELAASIVAILRKEADISVGNIIGSNIFNTLFVLGVIPVIHPLPCPSGALRLDFPVMLGFAVIALVFLIIGRGIKQWQGAALSAGYLVYIAGMAFRG